MLNFCVIKNQLWNALAVIILAGRVNSKFCNGGHICSPPKECCPFGCCLVLASPGYRSTVSQVPKPSTFIPSLLLWNHWLLWSLLILSLLFCVCGCGLWKKHQIFSRRLCYGDLVRNEEERSEHDSSGSYYQPPQYSRCSSFYYTPPPYSEVTSKPDLYPLVISYRANSGKFDDNCFMVQYFRNYLVHPALRSLSAESTVDSISSSFFGQSVHEEDINFPPMYEESRGEEGTLAELEPLVEASSLGGQSTHFLTQGRLLKNTGFETNILEHQEIHQIIIKNIQKSIQPPTRIPKLNSTLPVTFENNKTLLNLTQSLPNNLCSERTVKQKKLAKPSNLYLATFKKINKSVALFNSADSISGSKNFPAHQYSSDVILAQPQSYCDSNNELHYYSSDIFTSSNHCLHNVNNSYSSEDNLSQPRGSLQDFVSSDGLSHSQFSNLEINNFSTSSEVSSLQGCGSPDSPPQATSPTGEIKNLLDKIQQLPINKDSNKPSESNDFCFGNNHLKAYEASFPDKLSENETLLSCTQELNRNEGLGISCLLNQSALKCKPKENEKPIFSNKFCKSKFPTRSKTFNLPFSHISPSSKKIINLKLSTSAPVTPVSTFPSSGSTLTFTLNSLKLSKKKTLQNTVDGRPLLHDENKHNDEIF